MANVDNIRPYAKFAHEAAQHGGVDSYLDELANANYDLGASDTASKFLKFILLAIPTTIVLWEGGKAGYKKGKVYLEHYKEEARNRAETAKAAIKAEIETTEGTTA